MNPIEVILLTSLLTLGAAQTCPCTREIQEKIDKMDQNIQSLAAKIEVMNRPGTFASYPAPSCEQILRQNADSPSTYYWLRASDGTAVKMFCDMTRTCGGHTGGWMKVADLDMTQRGLGRCPPSLQIVYQFGGRPVCRTQFTSGGCASVQYETHGISYQRVCGKVIGYQQSSTDGAFASRSGSVTINQPYIDGVVLSHGYPRRHIWSFLAALHEGEASSQHTCYCANRYHRGPSPPSFVGQDYFCDTGCKQWVGNCDEALFTDPLWDGAGCGPNNECCTFHNPPWFYKYTGSTRDNIEMRICRDQSRRDEDILIEKAEIYVL